MNTNQLQIRKIELLERENEILKKQNKKQFELLDKALDKVSESNKSIKKIVIVIVVSLCLTVIFIILGYAYLYFTSEYQYGTYVTQGDNNNINNSTNSKER